MLLQVSVKVEEGSKKKEIAGSKCLRTKLLTLKMKEESQESRNAGSLYNLQRKGTSCLERYEFLVAT